METFAEQKEFVAKLNLIEDEFFSKVAEDLEACEEIIRIILQKPDLKLIDNQPQRVLRNIDKRAVTLDLLCEDANGNKFNVEVQKSDCTDHQKRMRYNVSNIDTSFVEKGIPFDKVPDIYAIMISAFDPFKGNHTTYHIHRTIAELNKKTDNGIHEIYVNTAVDDGTDISELMQYFLDSKAEINPKFEKLSKRVVYYKETNKGVDNMSSVFEEYAEKYAEKYVEKAKEEKDYTTAINMLKENASIEFIAKVIPTLSLEKIKELKENLEKE
ncbi:MAG: PD-(D/E)XK nuclease family transposase [Peptococcaceae bacterium]|nr:PD-(D/E)XK nuclease family transposase [Peptococcaceae bacterium]